MWGNLGLGLQQTKNVHLNSRLHTKDFAQVSSPKPQKSRIFTVQIISKKVMGEKVPFVKDEDSTPALSAAKIKLLQKYIVSLLFMGEPWT